jgi:hypothetical protein
MHSLISSTFILFSTLTKLISPTVIDNYDITVIGTVGGYLHAVDTITLEKIWSVNIGGPLLSAQEVQYKHISLVTSSSSPVLSGVITFRLFYGSYD